MVVYSLVLSLFLEVVDRVRPYIWHADLLIVAISLSRRRHALFSPITTCFEADANDMLSTFSVVRLFSVRVSCHTHASFLLLRAEF